VLAAITMSLLLAQDPLPKDVTIEVSQAQKGGQGLGTKAYEPTAKEGPFLKKVTEKEISFSSNVELPKPTNLSDEEWAKMKKDMEKAKAGTNSDEKYQLADQAGRYVGWFGILRKESWDPKAKATSLLVEHKYFDGMVDLHQQIVSLYGAGDFSVALRKEKTGIPSLALVCVYGKVTKNKDGKITVAAEYLRVWDWGLFSFMDYGKDKTNQDWVKLRKTKPEEAYSAKPTAADYEAVLGPREAAGDRK